jgi:hypothetical protein
MKEEKPQSNRMRIGIIVASVIVGVILALLSMLSPH